jgi:hypothetical protein
MDIKLSVPYRSFTACWKTLRVWKRYVVGKIQRQFLRCYSCFATRWLLIKYCRRALELESGMIRYCKRLWVCHSLLKGKANNSGSLTSKVLGTQQAITILILEGDDEKFVIHHHTIRCHINQTSDKASLNKSVFWYAKPCILVEIYWRFSCAYYLHHQSDM